MTPETKALIEHEANEFAAKKWQCGYFNSKPEIANDYIAGATPYAEKLEAAEQENKRLRDIIGQARMMINPLEQAGLWNLLNEALKPKQ